jgi:EAL domain-containing protein (putative c-di-GMP-specific phosphodiesterase class I)
MNQNRLLVIDDEPGICEFIKEVAEDVGFDARTTTTADDFRKVYRSFSPTAIILDLVMPGADGVEILRYLAEDHCQAQILVASGVDPRVLQTAKRIGDAYGLQMSGVLEKPIMVPGLQALLRKSSLGQSSVNEQGLSQAISERQLIVHYQPKLSFMNGAGQAVQAVEALVRWQHPQWGMVMPDKFIPIAEQSGLILPLTDLVARMAVEQLAEWDADGIDLAVAINLAPQLLNRLELPDRFAELADEHSIDRSRLMLEITESAAMADTGRTMDILARCRLKGMGVSIDDFGTGYSSLVALCRMPFNELKIDKSLVIELHRSEEAKLIVRSIVDLAHNLGLSVCAEGTETSEAVNFVRTCGCKSTQGYYISKPLAPDALKAFMADRH